MPREEEEESCEIVSYAQKLDGSRKCNNTLAKSAGNTQNAKYICNFLINFGGSSEDDKYLDFASKVAPQFLSTLERLCFYVSVVLVTAIVGYCLVHIMPHLVYLLSGILVQLPLGILKFLCDLLAPVMDLVFVHLPPAIGYGISHGVLAIGHGVGLVIYGVLWSVTSFLSRVPWAIGSVLHVIFMCVSLPFRFLYSSSIEDEFCLH